MANYISTLTGTQMDAAMTDMANHTSEAWAVGERSGVAVASGDVTYHNNAKYYAEQANTQITSGVARAEAAAARAEAAVPSGTAGAVFFDREQTLTEAQASQARANIQASNPNLLRNWYFVGGGSQLGYGVFPINQRGQTSYTGVTYTIDSWRCTNSGGTVNVLADCIELSSTSGSMHLRQYIATLPEGAYTFSAYFKGTGTIAVGVSQNDSTVDSNSISNKTDWTLVRIRVTSSIDSVFIRYIGGSGTAYIKSVKLEKGSYSTLSLDIPDFGEELYKCSTYSRPYVGASRENLLVNGWFRINQRGQSSYTTTGSRVYTVDMWKATTSNGGNGTVTVTENGITASYPSGNNYLYLVQILDERLISSIDGKMLSFSVRLNDGTVKSGSAIFNRGETKYFYSDDTLRLRIYSPNANRVEPTIDVRPGTTVNIVAAKLEIGMFPTIANDTVPDYTTELIKCQRYFFRVKGVTAARAYLAPAFMARYSSTSNVAIANIPTPVTMYDGVTPTAIYSGTAQFFRISPTSGTNPLLNITSVRVLTGSVSLQFSVPDGSALTSGDIGFLSFANNTGYIDISCEPVEV